MKPILFNTEMVKAILDGRKTITRRIIKPQPISKIAYAIGGYKCGTWGYPSKDAWKYWCDEEFRIPEGIAEAEIERTWNPPAHGGDILYVRENWAMAPDLFGEFEQPIYMADIPSVDLEEAKAKHFRWKPSIHMPKEIARLFLRVKSVRVERLQDITEEQAIAEGCYHGPLFEGGTEEDIKALWGFIDVWDSTIKRADLETYGWEANPWVWVIEFERCEKPETTT